MCYGGEVTTTIVTIMTACPCGEKRRFSRPAHRKKRSVVSPSNHTTLIDICERYYNPGNKLMAKRQKLRESSIS